MKKSILLFLLIGLSTVHFTFAQVKTENKNMWLHYVGKNMLTKKLSFTLEATMRYTDGFNQKQQWFVRPSLDYQFCKKFVGSVGYTHYNTYVYGEIPINKMNIPEDHVWIQGTYTHTSGDFKFIHRLRDENRFVGVAVKDPISNEYGIDHYDYRNRMRYMFLANYTITKEMDKMKLFGIVGDEAFVNIGTNAGKTFFNQSRVIAGLGYNINTHNQVQLNYIHQQIWNFGNTIQETNPTVRLTYVTNLDFSKK